jgi:hypothetical protein
MPGANDQLRAADAHRRRVSFSEAIARARVSSAEDPSEPEDLTAEEVLELREADKTIRASLDELLGRVQAEADDKKIHEALAKVTDGLARRHALLMAMAEARRGDMGEKRFEAFADALENGYNKLVLDLVASTAEAVAERM